MTQCLDGLTDTLSLPVVSMLGNVRTVDNVAALHPFKMLLHYIHISISSELCDPWFVHDYETVQKLVGIDLKQRETRCYMISLQLVESERGTFLSDSFPIPKGLVKILATEPWYIRIASTILCNFNFQSINNLSWFFQLFWMPRLGTQNIRPHLCLYDHNKCSQTLVHVCNIFSRFPTQFFEFSVVKHELLYELFKKNGQQSYEQRVKKTPISLKAYQFLN